MVLNFNVTRTLCHALFTQSHRAAQMAEPIQVQLNQVQEPDHAGRTAVPVSESKMHPQNQKKHWY